MAHNPQIEVFTLKLNPSKKNRKTFRDFAIESKPTYNLNDPESTESSFALFLDIFQRLLNETDKDDFIDNKAKKKAFGAYDTREDSKNKEPSIQVDVNNYVIHGFVEGGKYGQKRAKSSLKKKIVKEDVDNDDVILVRFYFHIHLPMNSDLGIIFIQSYTDDNITDLMRDFFEKFFSKAGSYHQAKINKYYPKSIIDQFKESCKINSLNYASTIQIPIYTENTNEEIPDEFIIKIEAISKTGVNKSQLEKLKTSIGEMIFGNKVLKDFEHKKAVLINGKTDKTCTFQLENSDDLIKPVIYLEEQKIPIDIDGYPDFVQLKEYCTDLQISILKEINPT